MIIYQYNCCCTASYIGLTTRQLRKRIKEHIPKSLESFCCLDNKDIIPAKVLNASKRSSIAQHLINNPTCANSYDMNRFKIINAKMTHRAKVTHHVILSLCHSDTHPQNIQART